MLGKFTYGQLVEHLEVASWKEWRGRTTGSRRGHATKRVRSGQAQEGDMGQIAAVQKVEVATNGGGAGKWAVIEGNTRPEMSVVLIFGWMEGVLYRLMQPPNMKARRLDLEQPLKIMPIDAG